MRSRTDLLDGCAESPRGCLGWSDAGRLPRWGLLLPGIAAVATAVMCAVPPVMLWGDDAAAPAVSGCIGPAHRLSGTWRVTYHPNAAVRVYTIGSTGVVRFEDFPAWKGTLVNRGAKAGSDLLQFEGDVEGRLERLTLLEDGRLLVEHYNPGATFLEEKRPDQIGLGDRIN